MTMPTQIDRFGQINISFIGGDFARPKVQLLGVRGIPGNTINHPCSFFVGDHSKRSFVERVDMVSGAGYDPARWQPGVRRDFHALGLVVSNLAVLDFGGPRTRMRLRSLHPGVTLEQVEAADRLSAGACRRSRRDRPRPPPSSSSSSAPSSIRRTCGRPCSNRRPPPCTCAPTSADRIAEVLLDHPPVNALDSAGWHHLATTITALGADDERERHPARRRGPRLLRRRRHQGAGARLASHHRRSTRAATTPSPPSTIVRCR